MYAALEVHTEHTLQAGEIAILKYDTLLKVLIYKNSLFKKTHILSEIY